MRGSAAACTGEMAWLQMRQNYVNGIWSILSEMPLDQTVLFTLSGIR